jgi:hypothetical protein
MTILNRRASSDKPGFVAIRWFTTVVVDVAQVLHLPSGRQGQEIIEYTDK